MLSAEAMSTDLKAPPPSLKPPEVALHKFQQTLDRLVAEDGTIGIAVSGGADSLALLLLAAAARPGKVEAATVDHQLRQGSRAEAKMVADLCKRLEVPHKILPIEWKQKPEQAIQERARLRRYAALAEWARERGFKTLVTAHHADDQAETLLMRLNRGSGVNGLAGMRSSVKVPGGEEALIRPLLGWRRKMLEEVCRAAYLEPVDDPSNHDEKYERNRIRKGLADANWLDPASIALSAAHLSEADRALTWMTNQQWKDRVRNDGGVLFVKAEGLPREIRRRMMLRALGLLASEGRNVPIRGREAERLLTALDSGRSNTLRGVRCAGGKEWTFAKAPARTKPA